MKHLKTFNESFEIDHTSSGEIAGELVNITTSTSTIEPNNSKENQRTTIKDAREKGEMMKRKEGSEEGKEN